MRRWHVVDSTIFLGIPKLSELSIQLIDSQEEICHETLGLSHKCPTTTHPKSL